MVQGSELRKSFYIGVKALRRNALQTTLTMLGMSIGVATLLTTIALGAGAEAAIQNQVRAAGMNVIVVSAGNYKMQQQWTNSGETEEPAAYEMNRLRAEMKSGVWNGVKKNLLRRVDAPGDNPIQTLEKGPENAAGRGGADTLSLADADAVSKLSGVQNVSGGVAENGTVTAGNAAWFTKVHGEQASLTGIRRAWVFPQGSFFSKVEVERGENVAVLGSIVSAKLFGDRNPVGEQILLKGKAFRVKGVVASGVWMVKAAPGDGEFDAVYVPVTTAMAGSERKSLDTLTISTESTGDVTRVTKAVTALLRARHGLGSTLPDDFVVASEAHKSLARGGMRTDVARAVVGNVSNLDKVTLDQLGKTLDKASRTMTALLGSIAVVSLVVGGIGIMNIMLLSVTERTREIGIRRAVGALSREVMLQFLMEAMTLSLVGGILGIVVGVGAAGLITKTLQWSTSVSPLVVLVSFSISAAIGVGFGYYPARQAARVSPMNSLRYE
jgi:ABC-type antimicrobial peptide transport system permease subunit